MSIIAQAAHITDQLDFGLQVEQMIADTITNLGARSKIRLADHADGFNGGDTGQGIPLYVPPKPPGCGPSIISALPVTADKGIPAASDFAVSD